MGNEIEKLQAVLQRDPSNFQARRELTILLANDGFNEEALSNLQYLIKYFPEDAELHYNIGILHEKLKDFDKAKTSYQKAIELQPQDDFYYNLGEVLVSLQEWDAAIEAFKSVLKNDSRDGNCYFNLGLCYFNKDEINLATDHFQQAINLNPKDIFAHFYLGNIYQNNGLTNFAVESYQKVLALCPDYSWAYYNLASIAYKNENLEEAKDYLLKTIEYNHTDIEAYKLLTKICLKLGETEEIITILETRLEREENGDLYYILAKVYKHVGRKEDYLEKLSIAIQENLTLTYPLDIVRKELKQATNDEINVEEVEEYSSDEYEETEDDDDVFEEDYSDEDENKNFDEEYEQYEDDEDIDYSEDNEYDEDEELE